MPPPSRPALVEGVDYYVERGNYVFTAHYLRNRGYCCGNGCRHCPWRPADGPPPPHPPAAASAGLGGGTDATS